MDQLKGKELIGQMCYVWCDEEDEKELHIIKNYDPESKLPYETAGEDYWSNAFLATIDNRTTISVEVKNFSMGCYLNAIECVTESFRSEGDFSNRIFAECLHLAANKIMEG